MLGYSTLGHVGTDWDTLRLGRWDTKSGITKKNKRPNVWIFRPQGPKFPESMGGELPGFPQVQAKGKHGGKTWGGGVRTDFPFLARSAWGGKSGLKNPDTPPPLFFFLPAPGIPRASSQWILGFLEWGKRWRCRGQRTLVYETNHSLKKAAWGGGALSGPLRLRVQSRSRTRLRIAASVPFLFRVCFKGVLGPFARLRPLNGLE